jgi:hypothetical protein
MGSLDMDSRGNPKGGRRRAPCNCRLKLMSQSGRVPLASGFGPFSCPSRDAVPPLRFPHLYARPTAEKGPFFFSTRTPMGRGLITPTSPPAIRRSLVGAWLTRLRVKWRKRQTSNHRDHVQAAALRNGEH